MPAGHDSNIGCWVVCPTCGAEYEPVGSRCVQQVVLEMSVEMPISASMEQAPIGVPVEVTQAIGRIFVEYASAECNLRSLLRDLPGHREMSPASEDLNRLEDNLPDVLGRTPSEVRPRLEECVRSLRRSFDAINSKRNVLAHGQLVGVASITLSLVPSAPGHSIEVTPDESSRNSLRIVHGRHGSVRLTEPEISEVLEAAIEFRRQVVSLARIAELRNQLSFDA